MSLEAELGKRRAAEATEPRTPQVTEIIQEEPAEEPGAKRLRLSPSEVRETAEQVAREEESNLQAGLDALVADMAVDLDASARDKLRRHMADIGNAHAQRVLVPHGERPLSLRSWVRRRERLGGGDAL